MITLKNILISISMAAICIITLLDLRGSVRILVVTGFIAIYLFQKIDIKIALLFFISAFTADLGVSYGIPAISIMQLICILHFIKNRKMKLDRTFMLCVIILLISQSYSVLFCGESYKNIIVFLVNFFLLHLVYQQFSEASENQYNMVLLFYLIGVCAAVIAGLYRRDANVESWIRFSGIWTDPNFLGMFCILGCTTVLSLAKSKIRLLLGTPVLGLFIYAGYLTQSRTFIYAVGILVVLFAAYIIFQNKTTILTKVLILTILLISAYYVYNELLIDVVQQRGITSDAGGTDWTNGRLHDTKINYQYWTLNIFNILFGFGVDNARNYTKYVAHNTYADILFQLGVVGVVALGAYFIPRIKQINWKKDKLYIISLLLYAGTLSMLTTDALYLFIGLLSYPSKSKKKMINQSRLKDGE